jgi:threonylcarbamoyladenosine tRNA methylthiotransferase MtaB
VAIWTDVIAGFPGETDDEFEQSYSYIEALDFAGLHVFRYSPRAGTKAAAMEGRVRDGLRKDRGERLLRLSERRKRHFAERLIGTEQRVLFEQPGNGLTDNYVRVEAPAGEPNTFAKVRLTGLTEAGARGEIVDG